MYDGIYRDRHDAPYAVDYSMLQWTPRPWQESVLHSDCSNQIVRAGRQVGKTEIIAIKALVSALDNKSVLVLGLTTDHVQAIFLRMKYYLIGNNLYERHITVDRNRPFRQLSLENGSTIIGYSAISVGWRRTRADVLLCDEADWFPDNTLLYAPVCVLHNENAEVLITSTPQYRPPTDPHSIFRQIYERGAYETFHVPSTKLLHELNREIYSADAWNTEVLGQWG